MTMVCGVKFVERHPFADPDVAARKIVEIANGVEAVSKFHPPPCSRLRG
jgi:hypothetical protein